jgi:WhiB family transcriptional regulator, redox-sensing transcriptional regulator
VTAAALGSRQAAVLEHLRDHPGLTATDLTRVFRLRTMLYQQLRALERQALVVSVTALDPATGRRVARWYVAPPGMVPPPEEPADPVAVARRRERDRLAQRARRARARGLVAVPAVEAQPPPDLPGAACVGADPDLFFPPDHYEEPPVRRRRVRKAADICAGCPVRVRCYQAAADRREKFGVFGGVDFGERKKAARAS